MDQNSFPASIPCRYLLQRQDNLMGETQQEEISLSPSPCALPLNMTLKKTLENYIRAWLEGPLGFLQRSSVLEALAREPCPQILNPGDPGKPVPGLGCGLLGRTDWEEVLTSHMMDVAPGAAPRQGSAPRASSGQRQSLLFHLRLRVNRWTSILGHQPTALGGLGDPMESSVSPGTEIETRCSWQQLVHRGQV